MPQYQAIMTISALLAAARAVVHAPPLAAYLLHANDLVGQDSTPKRLNACSVLRNVQIIAKHPDEADKVANDLLEALGKYHKSCARSTVDIHTLVFRMLHACHDAIRGRQPIVDAREPPKNDLWNAQEWSFVFEVFGMQLDGSTHSMTLSLPVTGTSLTKCFRDASLTITRFPPVLVIGFKSKKSYVDYTMDWSPGDSTVTYHLCAVVCQSGDACSTMADGGDDGWRLFENDTVTPIVDMNTIVTKDAVLLVYKKRR